MPRSSRLTFTAFFRPGSRTTAGSACGAAVCAGVRDRKDVKSRDSERARRATRPNAFIGCNLKAEGIKGVRILRETRVLGEDKYMRRAIEARRALRGIESKRRCARQPEGRPRRCP